MGILTRTSSAKQSGEGPWPHVARVCALQAKVAGLLVAMEGIELGAWLGKPAVPHLRSAIPHERLTDSEGDGVRGGDSGLSSLSGRSGGSTGRKRRSHESYQSAFLSFHPLCSACADGELYSWMCYVFPQYFAAFHAREYRGSTLLGLFALHDLINYTTWEHLPHGRNHISTLLQNLVRFMIPVSLWPIEMDAQLISIP